MCVALRRTSQWSRGRPHHASGQTRAICPPKLDPHGCVSRVLGAVYTRVRYIFVWVSDLFVRGVLSYEPIGRDPHIRRREGRTGSDRLAPKLAGANEILEWVVEGARVATPSALSSRRRQDDSVIASVPIFLLCWYTHGSQVPSMFASDPVCHHPMAFVHRFCDPFAKNRAFSTKNGHLVPSMPFPDQHLTNAVVYPFDMSQLVAPLADLEDVMWLRSVLLDSTQTKPPVKSSTRRVRSPEELECRRLHRRSMQKGYEKDYRQRKKVTREGLRRQWLILEEDLLRSMKMVRSKKMIYLCSSIPATPIGRLEMEAQALRAENHFLACILRSEGKLAKARDFFAQASMRQKVNELSMKPSHFHFSFSW